MTVSSRLLASVAVVAAFGTGVAVAMPSLSQPTPAINDAKASLTVRRAPSRRPLSLTNMLVGDTRTERVSVGNTGSGDGLCLLTVRFAGDSMLSTHLILSIREETRGRQVKVYGGPVGAERLFELGPIRTGGGERRFELRLSLVSTSSPDGDGALQGLVGDLEITWSALTTVARHT